MRFEELSPLQQEEFIKRYYRDDFAKDLIRCFGITTRFANIYQHFPPEVREEKCNNCGANLVLDRISRNDSDRYRSITELYCPNCKHKPFAYCRCKYCLKQEQLKKEEQKKLIKQVYGIPHNPIEYSNLSFEEKVYIGALVRSYGDENLYMIKPYIDGPKNLSPTEDLLDVLYSTLIDRNVLVIDPNSSLSAFDTESDEFPDEYYTYAVAYNVNICGTESKKALFKEILSPTFFVPELATEALKAWKVIAVAECIQYLLFEFNKIGFDFNPGDKTRAVFESLIEDFSVSQIYAIIWKGIKDVSRRYLEKTITKKHAANSVISICQKYGENIKLNGWQANSFARRYDLPQSELSAYFFNQVVKIGDKGFVCVPSIDVLVTEIKNEFGLKCED